MNILLKLEEASEIRNLKERSINWYKNYVSYFLNYVKKNPEELTCQDVREYILSKKKEGLKFTTLNLYNSAIRFFYHNVLHILWNDTTVPRMIIDHKLPAVLTPEEVDQLFDATDDLKYKVMFATMYNVSCRYGIKQHNWITFFSFFLRGFFVVLKTVTDKRKSLENKITMLL